MKRILLICCGTALLALAAFALVGARSKPTDFDEAKQLVAVRKAGHELLRSVGDSSSPLPPVQVSAPGTYVLSFSASFAFLPDSLQAVVDRALATASPGSDYIVKMVERPSKGIVFSYSVLGSEGQAIVPCLGREQADRLYDLVLQFRETPPVNGRLIAGAGGLLAAGLVLAGLRRPRKSAPVQSLSATKSSPAPEPQPDYTALGRYRFLPAQQCLLFENERIALTGKEAALLGKLAARPNELIERSELQKIWEDEGVIVGRSLDVFISRLRRKLEKDPALALVGVTGKGYRLEMKEGSN